MTKGIVQITIAEVTVHVNGGWVCVVGGRTCTFGWNVKTL